MILLKCNNQFPLIFWMPLVRIALNFLKISLNFVIQPKLRLCSLVASQIWPLPSLNQCGPGSLCRGHVRRCQWGGRGGAGHAMCSKSAPGGLKCNIDPEPLQAGSQSTPELKFSTGGQRDYSPPQLCRRGWITSLERRHIIAPLDFVEICRVLLGKS